jgi:plastocyanin
MTKLPLLLVPVLASALLTGCNSKKSDTTTSNSTNVAASAGNVSVTIKNFSFTPVAFTIHKGKTITFTNDDSTPHTATLTAGAPAKFDSGSLEQGKSATFTPETLGTYNYVCSFHANMKASFTVVN